MSAMRIPRALAAVALVMIVPVSSAGAMGAAGAGSAKTSLPVIERQVMCVTCKIPLNVAQSAQADRERAFIQRLIDEGKNEAQVKNALVNQYGASVLGLPSAHGFDLAVYLVPIAVVGTLLSLLLVLLPRWRRRASAHAAAEAARMPSGLAASDAARLDSDMARFD
jgi:cytochrome c-type biogenesis protein CcmH